MKLKITSKSQLSDKETFNLKIFKEPFCNNETKKKYKLYEMPKECNQIYSLLDKVCL